ncbi:MAG: bifunctional ornithine acetyltransferase/N-acetylglutamate synthase [Planctomycetaceae bacterium]|nr:bifunctional ornithine acetyltransferase/N-acetylglutamate synthase [Planctomycetaceae bacterium]
MNEDWLPLGFRWSGHHCGLKSNSDKPDYSLIVSDNDAVAAGVYTQNLVCAAPVILCRDRTPGSRTRAIVINSGNANACTGSQGINDAQKMAADVALELGLEAEQVLVMSTGIIGQFLPMEKLSVAAVEGVKKLRCSSAAFYEAANGILTTDKDRKTACTTVETSQGTVRIAAMAKGAGMIGPNMATMLAAVTTDANLSQGDVHGILKKAVDKSFNCISVEGHTSTNDTVLLLANGQANSHPLTGNDLAGVSDMIEQTLIKLAKQIPADGEGATHLIEILVKGAASIEDAKQIAETIGGSNLVKTCVAGNDPNWGRIASAAGYAGIDFDISGFKLRLNQTLLFDGGEPCSFDAALVSKSMAECDSVLIEVELNEGDQQARIWTSDLTTAYVMFNSDYHT